MPDSESRPESKSPTDLEIVQQVRRWIDSKGGEIDNRMLRRVCWLAERQVQGRTVDVLASSETERKELFKERTPESAAWQCAMMFAQATEYLLALHADGWKYLPLKLKGPLSQQVATLVYHCRDLRVPARGLEGKALPKLANAYQYPGFYGEEVITGGERRGE